MDRRSNPTCRKCGGHHYNFQPCPAPEPAGSMRASVTVRQPRPERDWVSRTRTVELGPGRALQPRRFTSAGRVTGPDGNPMVAPRMEKPQASLTYPKEVKNDG